MIISSSTCSSTQAHLLSVKSMSSKVMVRTSGQTWRDRSLGPRSYHARRYYFARASKLLGCLLRIDSMSIYFYAISPADDGIHRPINAPYNYRYFETLLYWTVVNRLKDGYTCFGSTGGFRNEVRRYGVRRDHAPASVDQ
jgi:hypothetical protein